MTGYLFDVPDSRDFAALGNILDDEEPDTSSNLWLLTFKVRDQGKTNRCVGYSVARALQIGYVRMLGRDPGTFSANDCYFKARLDHDAENVDGGTFLRSAFKGVQKYGCAPELVRPSLTRDINKSTTWKQQKVAHKFRGLRGYNRILSTSEETARQVRLALSRRIAVVGGWGIPKSFVDYSSGVYDPKDPPAGSMGHAMTVVSHSEDGTFRAEAHYGESFGERGFIRMSPEFLVSARTLWIADVRK